MFVVLTVVLTLLLVAAFHLPTTQPQPFLQLVSTRLTRCFRVLMTYPFPQMAQSREDSVYLAKLAEQAERYEGAWLAVCVTLPARGSCPYSEMVENMKRVASSDQELTVEERNLLSVAYKNVIGARRASWRIVSSIEQKEESKGNEVQVKMIKGYREKIEGELAKICEDILDVLDKHLIPSAASGESKVFYHKMWVDDLPSYLIEFRLSRSSSGWVTTTVTLLSSPLVTSGKRAPTSRSKPTRLPLTLPSPSSPLPIQFVSVLPSTSRCFTTRSSTAPTVRATLRSRRSMMPLLSLTPSRRRVTRTRPSLCNSSVTTSPSGPRTCKSRVSHVDLVLVFVMLIAAPLHRQAHG